MSIRALASSVDTFAAAVVHLTDAQLDLPWSWRDYDSDGIRFAYFRMLEDLRQLAADLAQDQGLPGSPSLAARLLHNYHAAFREMHALLIGIEDEAFEVIPAEGEWPLRKVIAHMVDADVGFFAVISETLKALRAGQEPPRKLAEDIWDGMVGMPIAEFDHMLEHDPRGVLEFHQAHHARILREFSTITDEEAESPSYYWEKSPYTLRFRLGRFESHLRQHNIQLHKTRMALGRPLSESQRLLLLIFSALSEIENLARPFSEAPPQAAKLAASFQAWTQEIVQSLD